MDPAPSPSSGLLTSGVRAAKATGWSSARQPRAGSPGRCPESGSGAAAGGTSPVLAGGLLYVYGPAGGLRVYVPRTGKLVTTLPAGGGHWNSPIVVDGRVALPEGNANDHATSGVLDVWR